MFTSMSLFQLQDVNQPAVFTNFSHQPNVSPAPVTTSSGPSVGVIERVLYCGACCEAEIGVVGGRDVGQRSCLLCRADGVKCSTQTQETGCRVEYNNSG